MMENRKKIGLLIIAVAVLILIIIIVMLMKKTSSEVNGPAITNTTGKIISNLDGSVITPTSTPGDKARNYQTYDASKEATHEVNSNDAAKISSLFATRLGSFSNQSDYGNVTDLKIFMTASMRDWADKYVTDLKAQKYTGEYYGITTNTLTTKVLSYDEKAGKAKVEVTTERREDRGTKLGTTYQQKMTVDLVKDNNSWLVDNAVWGTK
jgi:hypothetical protein